MEVNIPLNCYSTNARLRDFENSDTRQSSMKQEIFISHTKDK